jgi:ComF family protein
MFNFLRKLKIFDILYYDRCYFCGSLDENSIFCEKCFSKLETLPLQPLRTFEDVEIFSATKYENNIKKLVHLFKYKDKERLSSFCAQIMFDYWEKVQKQNSKSLVIIPVPIHWKRKLSRRYDHMELIASDFLRFVENSQNLNFKTVKIGKNLVKRVKDTKPQYNMSVSERSINLKNAFEINENTLNKLKNQLGSDLQVLLIDDITTTGSTFIEILKVLKANGVKNLTALSLASPTYYKS